MWVHCIFLPQQQLNACAGKFSHLFGSGNLERLRMLLMWRRQQTAAGSPVEFAGSPVEFDPVAGPGLLAAAAAGSG